MLQRNAGKKMRQQRMIQLQQRSVVEIKKIIHKSQMWWRVCLVLWPSSRCFSFPKAYKSNQKRKNSAISFSAFCPSYSCLMKMWSNPHQRPPKEQMDKNASNSIWTGYLSSKDVNIILWLQMRLEELWRVWEELHPSLWRVSVAIRCEASRTVLTSSSNRCPPQRQLKITEADSEERQMLVSL